MIYYMKGSQISRLNILRNILPHKRALYMRFATAAKENRLLLPEGVHASIEKLRHSALSKRQHLVYASNIVLADHSDAGFHNESKGLIRSWSNIFLSENDPEYRWNWPVLTISEIIKFVMTSAAEAELRALLIIAK